MSLRKAKVLYFVWIGSIAVILMSTGGVLGIVAAILMLIGALPMFQAIGQAFSGKMLTAFEYRVRDHLATRLAKKQLRSDHSDNQPEALQ